MGKTNQQTQVEQRQAQEGGVERKVKSLDVLFIYYEGGSQYYPDFWDLYQNIHVGDVIHVRREVIVRVLRKHGVFYTIRQGEKEDRHEVHKYSYDDHLKRKFVRSYSTERCGGEYKVTKQAKEYKQILQKAGYWRSKLQEYKRMLQEAGLLQE